MKRYLYDRRVGTVVAVLLAIVALICFSSDIELWAVSRKNFVEILSAVPNLIIGMGLLFVGWEANNIASTNQKRSVREQKEFEYRLSKDERDAYKENFSKVSEAIGMVFRDGKVTREAMNLFWDARDQARLELADDIINYTEELRSIASKIMLEQARCYDSNGQPLPTHNPQSIQIWHQELDKLLEQKPYEKYRKYTQI